MAWRPCWLTKQSVLSFNMAATLSFGSPGIGCKPRIPRIGSYELYCGIFEFGTGMSCNKKLENTVQRKSSKTQKEGTREILKHEGKL